SCVLGWHPCTRRRFEPDKLAWPTHPDSQSSRHSACPPPCDVARLDSLLRLRPGEMLARNVYVLRSAVRRIWSLTIAFQRHARGIGHGTHLPRLIEARRPSKTDDDTTQCRKPRPHLT